MDDFPLPYTNKDTVEPLSPGRSMQVDVLRAFQGHNRCLACRFLDLEALHQHWEQEPEIDGQRITLTSLYVKAAALALRESPRLAYHLHGYKEIRPATFDIGISVAGTIPESPMAPTIVLNDALNRPLAELSSELRTLSREARLKEAADVEELGKIATYMPIGFLRRWLVGLAVWRYGLRRKETGVFQISNCHGLGIDFPVSSVVPHSLFLAGEVRPHPVAVDGEVKIHRCAWGVLMFDHAEIVATHAGAWLTAFQGWLSNPDALYAATPSEPNS